jgi:hypothetical protein
MAGPPGSADPKALRTWRAIRSGPIIGTGQSQALMSISVGRTRSGQYPIIISASVPAGCPCGISVMKKLQASETLTLTEAFDAMGLFLHAIRRRHGEAAGALDFVIGGLKWADGSPADPSMWEDWVTAATTIRRGPQTGGGR